MTAAEDTANMDLDADDRRRYSRVRFPKVRVQAPGPEGWQDEFLQDLSIGGVFLVSPRTLPVGGEVDLRLLVPDSETPLEVTACVTRIEQGSFDSDSGMALAFFDLRPEQLEKLGTLVERFGHEPTVTLFDDETGEPQSTPAENLMRELDELGRQWASAKDEIASARSSMAGHEKALKRNQEALETVLRRVQDALRYVPNLPSQPFGQAPEAPVGLELPNGAAGESDSEGSRNISETLDQVRDDLASERERSRELSREVDDLRGSLDALESPGSGRDQRIQMLTSELLQMKEQAHRHEAEAAEARLALAELRSQTDLTSGEHLPPPSLASLRGAQREEEDFEIDFAIQDDMEPLEDLETLEDETLHAIPLPRESSFADVAAEVHTVGASSRAVVGEGEPRVAGDVSMSVPTESQDTGASTEGRDPVSEPSEGARLVELSEETLGPEVLDTIEAFETQLNNGSKIRRTERFGRLEPVSRGDIQVSDWLGENDRLNPTGDSSPDMPEAQLLRVLHVFFQRELIRLTP